MAPNHHFLLPKPFQNGLGSKKWWLGAIYGHFTTFYFFRLIFCVKNEPKWPKNRFFSILDRSANLADKYDL